MKRRLHRSSSPGKRTDDPSLGRSFGLAFGLHALLIILLILSWSWQMQKPGPIMVELWTEGNTQQIARSPDAQDEPVQTPEPEPQESEPAAPAPDPQPAESEPAPTPPPVEPPTPAPVPSPVASGPSDAEIALEEERKREQAEKEHLAKLAQEKQEKERLAKLEQERLEKERQAKLAQEKLEKERLAKLEQEKLEKERQAKLAQEKLEKDRLAKLEQEKLEKAKRAAEQKAREDAERKKQEEARKKAAAEQALRDAFRSDVMGATGIAGGTASQNREGGGADAVYAGKIRACIRPNVSFPSPVRSGNTNPAVLYRVQLKSDGSVMSVSLRRGSGNSSFDRAVENGIRRCSPFPEPPSGRYPSYIDVNYQMYD